MASLRLIFMGTPDFAVPILTALAESGHDVICVYTQPPRAAGRGHRETRSPVHEEAAVRDIPVRHPKSLRDETVQAEFAALGADLAIIAAYGLILPKPVLEAPRLGCINVHASLLPRWRGAAPIQHAIMAGDKETGVTIMQMDEGLDTGDILLMEKVPLGPSSTASGVHDILAWAGARLCVAAVEGLATGRLKPRPQPKKGVKYAAKLTREDGRLDWTRPARELERRVRALNPWPGVWFEWQGERIKVLGAEVVRCPAGTSPGVVVDPRLAIACKTGALRPTYLQRPGRGAVDIDAFLRGFSIPEGTRLPVAGGG